MEMEVFKPLIIKVILLKNTTLKKIRCIQGFKKCQLSESLRDQQNGVITTNGI